MSGEGKRALGRRLILQGWVCAFGIALVIVEMAQALSYMPENLWRPPGGTRLEPGQFDLRTMVIFCPGPIGWLGGWGYLASLLWVPFAAWRALRAAQGGVPFSMQERILLAAVPTLIIVVQVLLRATPLRYGYPLL